MGQKNIRNKIVPVHPQDAICDTTMLPWGQSSHVILGVRILTKEIYEDKIEIVRRRREENPTVSSSSAIWIVATRRKLAAAVYSPEGGGGLS